jgi:hypothetical protein
VIDETVNALEDQRSAISDSGLVASPQSPVPSCFPSTSPPTGSLPWRRLPDRVDVEVCTFAALERAWREAEQPTTASTSCLSYENEPVIDALSMRVLLLPEDHRAGATLRALLVNHDPDYGSLRWTVDTSKTSSLPARFTLHRRPRRFHLLEIWTSSNASLSLCRSTPR